MIYDKIENAERYKGMDANLDKALAYLAETNFSLLPNGRTEIDGDDIFVNVMEISTIREQDGKYEYHKKYRDIQLDIEGCERILAGTECLGEVTPYREEAGIVLCREEVCYLMEPGKFVILNTGEYHMPGIQSAEHRNGKKVRKAVIKVSNEVQE